MRRLYLVPPLAALAIIGMSLWKITRPPVEYAAVAMPPTGRPAPLFELYDDNSQIVRVARYIGRHKLLIVFFDGRRGPDRSELLLSLRREWAAIEDTGAIVLAISDLRPAEHRPPPGPHGERIERDEPFRFPMLSDINDHRVHRLYGAFDETRGAPREAVFVIDRAGAIRHAHVAPDDLGTPRQWADELRSVK